MAPSESTYRRTARAPWVALAMLALLALSLVPAAARAQQFVSVFEPSDCPVSFPEEVTVDCGYVVVPESHNNFDGDVLRLAVAVLRSPNPNKAPDPVFYLEGGPGGSPLNSGAVYAEIFSLTLLNFRDVVLIDQRGTGYSQPGLFCSPLAAKTIGGLFPAGIVPGDQTPPQVVEQAQEISTCLQDLAKAGADLQYFNTAENSADLEDIRRALGYGQINLYGTSYGTELGLTMLRYRSESVRSAVLDAIVPPQTRRPLRPLSSFNESLSGLIAACNGEATCAAAFGDIGADFDAVVSRLNANPVVLPIIDLENDQIVDYYPVTGVDFNFVVFQVMYSTELMQIVPAFISLTADGRYDLLALLFSAVTTPGDPRSIADGMYYATTCNDDIAGLTVDDFVRARDQNRRTASVAESAVNNEVFIDVCAGANLAASYPDANDPVTSSVPTYLIAGQLDPITPPSLALEAKNTLSNSFFVEYPRGGHVSSLQSLCMFVSVALFINDPSTAPDTSCIAEEAPLPFVTPDAAQATVLELKNTGKLLELARQIR